MPWFRNNGRVLTAAFATLGVLYPLIVYFGLQTLPGAGLLALLMALLLLRALLFGWQRQWPGCLACLLLAVMMALVAISQTELALLLYPVLVSLLLAGAFTLTLLYPPPMIERFARLQQATLDDHGIRYTRRLTLVWIVFFLINASIAAWTATAGTLEQWTLYNGFISYLLVGALFFGEWPLRHYLRRRQTGPDPN